MNLASSYHLMRSSARQGRSLLPETRLDELVSAQELIRPPITDKLCLPPFRGPKGHNDVHPLLALAKAADPAIILEFGTAHGATVANLCALTRARVYTVNALPHQIEGKRITFALSQEEIGCVYRQWGYADRVVQIYANTKKLNLAAYLADHSVDLAIIDACHDADFVVSDFLRILPMLHEGSLVLLHDVHPSMRGHLAESYVACMYLRTLGYDIRHLAGTWWGLWRAPHRTRG